MCIWVHEYPAEWPCPEGGRPSALCDHQPERRWRHWDTCQLQAILHAGPSRSRCAEHGARTVKLPWAEPGSRFRALFERLAMDWLLAASQQPVAERLKLRWEEVHAIQERAVKRAYSGAKPKPVPRLGVDEKAFTRGQRYFTIVNDLSPSRVLFVTEHRETQSLDPFWASLTAEQLTSVQAVAMDMWDPYVNSTLNHLPEAAGKIVFDKFHIAKHLSEAVDLARRRENKQLKARGDDRHGDPLRLAPASRQHGTRRPEGICGATRQ